MGKIQRKLTNLKPISTGTNGKKRWAKGHSSDSNPLTRTHRDAATNRFYHPTDHNNDLRLRDMKMLEKMDLNLGENKSEDGLTISEADTVATRLSNITNCTNPTFDKVHRIWRSGSKLHADILTVLASVTEGIKAQGGKESEIEYFAALLNPLIDPSYSNNLLAATSYLLSLVIRKVPKPVLIQQFDRISEIIYGSLRKAKDSSDEMDEQRHSILRYLISCLGYLLEIRPKQFWTSPYDVAMEKMLDSLLECTIHEKPRIRKSAQKAIAQIFLNNSNLPTIISKRCADFCVRQMEQFSDDKKGRNTNLDSTFHVFNFLQYILHRFSTADLKRTVEIIFKVLTLSNNLTTMGLNCLYSMFRNRPSNETLAADLNAKIILATYDFQPLSKETRTCVAWISLITEAHACLLERDIDISSEYVGRLANVLAQYLSDTEHANIVAKAVECMKKIYGDFASVLAKNGSDRGIQALERYLEILEKLLAIQYYAVWPHVFGLFALFFESTNPAVCSKLRNFKTSLKLIADLRESESFPCKLPAEQALGMAIHHIGPEEVLAAIPLGLNPDSPSSHVLDFPRSWLLPLLRTKINGAKLSFFSDYFFPLAIKIDQRIKSIQSSGGDQLETKVLETIESQIWELFPSFCKNPTDLIDSFPNIARALGAALMGRPKLRLSILGGLRKLMNLENREDVKIIVDKYGRNYLNILLQLYSTDDEKEINSDYDVKGVRLAILETIRSFLKISPIEFTAKYLDAVLEKLKLCSDQETEKKLRLMDILLVLSPYLDPRQRGIVYELNVELLSSGGRALEKKCWRIFEELCGGQSEAANSFISSRLNSLKEHLKSNLTKASPATKACRLRCLILILDKLKESATENDAFIFSILPDVVNCLYGTSGKARKSAAKLIVKCVTMMGVWKKDVNVALGLVLDKIMVMDDEISSQELASSIYANRLLCYEFRNDISADLLSSTLGKICQLLNNENRRPVCQSCVEFLKTFVGCYPEFTVSQFLDTIISALCNQDEDSLKYCRRLIRKVMAKLVKRFSYVTIKKFVPESYEKQLNNIRKLVARAEKRKTANEEGQRRRTTSTTSSISDETGTVFTSFTNLSRPETIADLLKDTSDEDESDEESDKKSMKGRKAPPIWLKEGDEEEVVDLMDRKFAQQMVISKPKFMKATNNEPTKNKNRGFKTTSDGRLVITMDKEDDHESDDNKKRKRHESVASDESESIAKKSARSVKRVHFDDYEDQDDHVEKDDNHQGASSYVPGGKGIHRRLREESRKKKAKGDKKSKSSMDPYAYVPLDKKALNKRKRIKMDGRLKNLVQGAKKGATKGSKGKIKKRSK